MEPLRSITSRHKQPDAGTLRPPGSRLARVLTSAHAAQAIRAALTVPDPSRVSSPVRVYGPDGTLRETVTPHEWATRYPRRFMRPSSPGRRRISW